MLSVHPSRILWHHWQCRRGWRRDGIFTTFAYVCGFEEAPSLRYSVSNIKVYIWNLRPAQFVLSNFKLRFYWDVTLTFILEGHMKKISQFSMVRSQSSIMSDHPEKPLHYSSSTAAVPKKPDFEWSRISRHAWYQKIPWVNTRILVCCNVGFYVPKPSNSGFSENRIICRNTVVYRNFWKISKHGRIYKLRAIF